MGEALYGLTPEKVDLLRNPTAEKAMKLWPHHVRGMEQPLDGTAALAGVHKARLLWPGSTKAMVRESKEWLRVHGYGVTGGFDPGALQAANMGKSQ
jgi:hypothetical protein